MEYSGEDRSVLFEVQHTMDIPLIELAVDEYEPGVATPVEVDQLTLLDPLLDEPGP